MVRHGRGFPLGTQFISTPITAFSRVVGVAQFTMTAVGRLRLGGAVTQFARPSEDILNENWTKDDGGTTTIFTQIDEDTRNDLDFIQSPSAPTSDVYVYKLSPVVDPQQSAGHTFKFTYGKDLTGGSRIDQLIELRQGYVSEGSPGTLIATLLNEPDVDQYPIAGIYTLSAAEADLITDYTNLYVRNLSNQV